MKIIYPISFDDIQVGDWIDWDTPEVHHHEQVTEVTHLHANEMEIETSGFFYKGDFAKFRKAVVSRVVDDSYKPKPKRQWVEFDVANTWQESVDGNYSGWVSVINGNKCLRYKDACEWHSDTDGDDLWSLTSHYVFNTHYYDSPNDVPTNIPTEPGFYKDKDGDLWGTTQGGEFFLLTFVNPIRPNFYPILPNVFAPYTRVKFVDCEES
ncbi:MAG: hypothetical protein ABF747_02390 [Bifidobacterium sp.]|uniref:DUF1349 domain-containing protein n=1 Tax=Bifidobacterium fermentum TaxID=3059035 RepID=A0AB39UR50_9BIFI